MKKGKLLETLVRFIHESYKYTDKIEIFQNHHLLDKHDEPNEFDVVIISQINNIPICIAIECKDHKSKIPISLIDSFNSKCNRVPNINKKVFVSKVGYQKGALKAAQDFDIDLYQMNDLNQEILQSWIKQSQFKEVNYVKSITNISLLLREKLNSQLPPFLDWSGDKFNNESFKIEQFAIDYCLSRTEEITKIVSDQRDILKSNGTITNKIWIDLPVDLEEFNVYTFYNNQKIYIDKIIITVQNDFNEKDIQPIVARSLQNINSEIPQSEIFSFLSPNKELMYSVIRSSSNPNHTDIMVTKPDGSPIPPHEMPQLNFPDGLKVDIKYD